MLFNSARLAKFAVVWILAAVCALAGSSGGASAQDHRQNTPGQFDFYLLVLSWSPSYCAANAERDRGRARPDPECGPRPYSFVVHGLWPQYDRGFPEFCQVPPPRLARGIMQAMLDLMPAPNLIYHEWDRHGTCSGLPQGAYFDTIRKARAVVKIPPQYLDLSTAMTVTGEEVADAFATANPGLSPKGVEVECGGRRLSEIRICMTRDLGFRDCPETTRRACTRDLIMPPIRG